MNMRKSRILKQLRANKVATSMKLNLSDVRNAEMAAMFGFDSIWIDMEHTPNDYASVENIIRAAKIYDVDVITRIDKGSYSDMIRPLEADSTAIMIPHLMSYEEAKKVVYYTKFYPKGRRPLDGGNADGSYCNVNTKKYIEQANSERLVIVQIEDPEPLAELEQICELDGIDMLFFGPADYSQGIGKPGDLSCGEVTGAQKLVAKCARKHGKFAGTVGSPQSMGALIDMGYQLINVGADVAGLSKYYLNICEELNKVKTYVK